MAEKVITTLPRLPRDDKQIPLFLTNLMRVLESWSTWFKDHSINTQIAYSLTFNEAPDGIRTLFTPRKTLEVKDGIPQGHLMWKDTTLYFSSSNPPPRGFYTLTNQKVQLSDSDIPQVGDQFLFTSASVIS